MSDKEERSLGKEAPVECGCEYHPPCKRDEFYRKCLIEAGEFVEELADWFESKSGYDNCEYCAKYPPGEVCERCKRWREQAEKCRQKAQEIKKSAGVE